MAYGAWDGAIVLCGDEAESGVAMSSDDYLQQATIGGATELNGCVVLCEYDDSWAEQFQRERYKIESALADCDIEIEHVGSTSVPGLCAKPIIDVLLLVEDSADAPSYVPVLEQAGYTLRIREPGWYEHRMLRGENPEVNLHVFSHGCGEAARMIAFRDWLRAHDEDREAYATAKRELADRTWKYVQHYADAKSDVVATILRRAGIC